MSVTLKVLLNEEKAEQEIRGVAKESCGEYMFTKSEILIGRHTECDLYLNDPKQTVSREHLKIIQSVDGYELRNLNPRNATLLNGTRLDDSEQRFLAKGDVISLGIFNIEFGFAVNEGTQHILMDGNPFAESVADMMASIQKIYAQYDLQPVGERDTSLREALGNALRESPRHDSLQVITTTFSDNIPIYPPPKPAPLSAAISVPPTLPDSGATGGTGMDIEGRYEVLFDALLDTVRQLLQIPNTFHAQFIQTTMIVDKKNSFLYAVDASVTKKFFLDGINKPGVLEQKLSQLENAKDEVLRHQVGMLEGYHAVVKRIGLVIVEQFDPRKMVDDLPDESLTDRLFPVKRDSMLWRAFVDKFEELEQTNWEEREKKYFRRPFISAYSEAINERGNLR